MSLNVKECKKNIRHVYSIQRIKSRNVLVEFLTLHFIADVQRNESTLLFSVNVAVTEKNNLTDCVLVQTRSSPIDVAKVILNIS